MANRDSILSKYELDDVDKRILELRLRYPTITDSEIGKVIGLARQNVNKRQQKKAFIDAMNQFTDEPLAILSSGMKKAARVVLKALDSNDERLKVGTAIKMMISHGAMKTRPDGDPMDLEPVVIRTSREVIEVTSKAAQEMKKLEKGKP